MFQYYRQDKCLNKIKKKVKKPFCLRIHLIISLDNLYRAKTIKNNNLLANEYANFLKEL